MPENVERARREVEKGEGERKERKRLK